MEYITLSTPVQAVSGATEFRVSELCINVEQHTLMARLRESNAGVFIPDGRIVVALYTGTDADTLISALNTANLSTKSLQRRIIERVIADGKLPTGTLNGTPQ